MYECEHLSAERKCLKFDDYGYITSPVICNECRGKGLGKCKYMKKGKDREGCSCFYVECQNPECPVYGVIGPQISRHCTPGKCKHFEQD